MATSAEQLHTELHGPAIAELIEIVLEGVEDRNLRGVLAGLVANGEMDKACLLKDLHMPFKNTMTVYRDAEC